MPDIKLAVFDMAGTTLEDDNAVAAAFMKAFELYGYAISEDEVKPLMGYKKTEAIKVMLERLGADANQEMINDIHREFEIEMIDHYKNSPDVRPIKGAEEILKQLKERGLDIAMNTGFSKEIADTIMTRLQWIERGIVDDYIASDEVEQGRPKPFMIQELMKRAGVDDPKEVIKIGDTETDINEGRNAGCAFVIAVTTGAFTKEQLEPYSPDHIIDNLSELPAIIFDRE